MPLFGPRLDRPDAIGDEGRPRAASLWIASLVVVVVTGGAGILTGQPGLLPSLGTMVGVTVAGVGLLDRERFFPLLFGHVAFFLFGSILVLNLTVAVFTVEFGLGVVGLALAMFGVGVTWADVGAADGTKRTLAGITITYGVMIASLSLLVVLLFFVVTGWFVVSATTEGVSPAASLVWFLLVVGVTAGTVRVALWRIPFGELLGPRRWPTVEPRFRQFGWVLVGTGGACVLLLLGVLLLTYGGAFARLEAVSPALATALDFLSSRYVLGILAAVGSLAIAVTVATFAVRLATRSLGGLSARIAAGSVAGILLSVLVLGTLGALLVIPSIGNLSAFLLVMLASVVGPFALIVGLPVVLVGVYGRVVPDRAGGPALAAAGLVLAGVGFATGPPVVVFGCVVGAVLVWDLSAYGLGLTAELGHLPETRRQELFHAVLVVGVGVVVVAALSVLDLVRYSAFGGVGGTAALFVAGVGALLLLFPLRG